MYKYILILSILINGLVFGDEPIKFEAWINRQPPIRESDGIVVFTRHRYSEPVIAFIRRQGEEYIAKNVEVDVRDNGSYFSFKTTGQKPPYEVFIFKADKFSKNRNVPNNHGFIEKIEILH